MANMMQMMKQAASMQKDLKKIQKELARQTFEASSGGVRVTVNGALDVTGVAFAPELAASGDAELMGKLVVKAVNEAMAIAKKTAGREMGKLTSGMGLPGLPGM